MEFLDVSEIHYEEIVTEVIKFSENRKVWIFNGNLGAGKTTLIKYLVKALGITENVQSPTFSLVNNYGDKVYHFDFYRLISLHEALDFGFEEYLDSGLYCWIEWPEIVKDILPSEILEIKINHTKNNTRNIYLKKINSDLNA